MNPQFPQIDGKPHLASALPFASESGLQQFVEDHSEQLLGVRVVASSRKGGHGVFRIDTLAEDGDGRPWIIECKYDLVDSGAIRQLRLYREALKSGWESVASRFRVRKGLGRCPEPLLVAIGYRFEETLGRSVGLFLQYRYHDIDANASEFGRQVAGRVSLAPANNASSGPHPLVSKREATVERLKRNAPDLIDSFWRLDGQLRGLPGVKVKYGGKNFVRYSANGRVFAEAVVGDGVINWEVSTRHCLDRDASESKVLECLVRARQEAG